MENINIWINIILTIFSIFIPVFATVYTVNKRIKGQNRENHQPYLVLDKIETINKIDIYSYHLTFIGRNYDELTKIINEEEFFKIEEENSLSVNLIIKNIGYGVATNIKFYNLLTGNQVYGAQASNKEKNQKLFTTFDIGASEQKRVQAIVINQEKESDGIFVEDHNRILCVYQDLNQNINSFIIVINVKDKNYYDFFAYQPSSNSYKKWIKENKIQYKVIIKKYSRS